MYKNIQWDIDVKCEELGECRNEGIHCMYCIKNEYCDPWELQEDDHYLGF